jgi:hypothetical protein
LAQWQVQVQAQEQFDFETQNWVPFVEEANEITGYLVMFSKKNEMLFHVQNIMNAVEWDGRSIVDLNRKQLVGAGIQFKVIEESYEGKVQFKLHSVGHWDAIPSAGGVHKLDEADLKGMAAQFDALLKRNAGPAKAVSAQTPAVAPPAQQAKPGRPAKSVAGAPGVVTQTKKSKVAEVPPPVEQDDETPELPFGDEPDPAIESAAEQSAPPPSIDAPAPAVAKSMQKNEAWAQCVQMKAKTITTADLTKSWNIAVRSVGKPEGTFTGQDWAKVCETVTNETGVF